MKRADGGQVPRVFSAQIEGTRKPTVPGLLGAWQWVFWEQEGMGRDRVEVALKVPVREAG